MELGLKGRRALVTAATRGLGRAFAEAGAEVTLISGPTSLQDPSNVKMIRLRSAEEMFAAANKEFGSSDITVLAAAVADYTPRYPVSQKIKKQDESFNLELIKTIDIASGLGKIKKPGQVLAGFALETENEMENAKKKLISKNFDLIIINSLNDNGAGFGHDTNKIRILTKDNKIKDFELKSKKEVAADIIAALIEKFHA